MPRAVLAGGTALALLLISGAVLFYVTYAGVKGGLPKFGESLRRELKDAGGHSGLEDEVDNHWSELFKAGLISTILDVGAELGSGADSGSNADIIQALR
jgi:hypothetical protein